MALQDMIFEITGAVPGVPNPLAQTKINEALGRIYDESNWSFQIQVANWLTPGLLFPVGAGQSAGTITTTAFSSQVVGDATASAAWAAYTGLPLLTQCQIRSPYYSLYNIIGYDTTSHPPYGTFTLDRPWMEPPNGVGTGIAYMIYQAYFPVPVPDFKRFFEIQDFTNFAEIDYWSFGQKDLAKIDPQRTNFDQPTCVAPFQQDQRPGSATLGNMLYELYPHPLQVLPYTFTYLRRGPLLVNPADTVPYPLTDELVKWRAYEVLALWKEGQKGDGMLRGSGADWRFLSGANKAEYQRELKVIRDRDRDLYELYWSKYIRRDIYADTAAFATINGGLNVGS